MATMPNLRWHRNGQSPHGAAWIFLHIVNRVSRMRRGRRRSLDYSIRDRRKRESMRTDAQKDDFAHTLRMLPGYPFLPCPICNYTESCNHIVAERAQAALPGLVLLDEPLQHS